MYIIIGASSFIGVYTANAFKAHGCDVLVTGRNNKFREYYEKRGISYAGLDLTNADDFLNLPQKDVDGVILLAGLLPANAGADLVNEENAADYIKVNTIGTINVLEYCRRIGVNRVISTVSFADVAKSWGCGYAISEEEPRNFHFSGDHAVYVISKNAAADIMEYYNEQHAMHNAWFRLPPVYGVGPHGSLLVNGVERKSGLQIFIENALAGKPIEIHGNKDLSRDFVYVKDVAEAFYLAMQSEKTEGLYNMTSGHGTTLEEQAEVIAEVFKTENGKSEIIYRPEISNNGPSYLFSIEKARNDFGYIPRYADFNKMMSDYKAEMETGEYSALFS